MRRVRRLVTAALLAGAAAAAAAQTVGYNGRLGDKAVLVIDGVPRTLSVGAAAAGVRLLAADAEAATVEVAGQRRSLVLGAVQSNLGGAPSPGGGSRIVLSASSGGHFVASGTINGTSASFLVDTGATMVAIGRGDAERMRVDWKNGAKGLSATANGNVETHRVKLDAVRIGDVTVYNVDAVVLPVAMPFVLLGNSFLTRFQMKRENDVLTLDRRY